MFVLIQEEERLKGKKSSSVKVKKYNKTTNEVFREKFLQILDRYLKRTESTKKKKKDERCICGKGKGRRRIHHILLKPI